MEDKIIVGTQTNGRYREVVFAYWVVPIHCGSIYILHCFALKKLSCLVFALKGLSCLLLSDVNQNNGLFNEIAVLLSETVL